jgi:hypothetical protein
MWFHPRRRLIALVGATAMLALAGCSGDASPDEGQQADRELPGIMEFGLTEVEYVDHIERTQQLIAECMRDAGFEYIPVDVKTVQDAQARVRTDPGYTRRTYKEKWGLGVTTRFDDPVRDVGLGPNLEIWQSLPPADREAYAHTLWGDEPKSDFVFTFDEEDFSITGGCTRGAVSQVFTPAQMKGTYVNPKDVLVETDPRIIEAQDNWTECMREAGYEYEDDQDEIIEDLEQRLAELLEGDDPRTLTGPRLAALHRLQEEEIKLSLIDLRCQIEHTDEIFRQVEFEVFGQAVSG